MWLDRKTNFRSVGLNNVGASLERLTKFLPLRMLLITSVALSLLIFGGLLIYGSGRGLDLTDEIFYLVWAGDPNAYRLVYQPFGYLVHPLFELVGGDLQIYRLAGFAIAAGAGALLGFTLSTNSSTRLLFLLYGAVSALTIFFPWIITPSYNSAANVGALLIIAGVLNIPGNGPGMRVAGVAAGAAGLCIAAYAKPPLFVIAVAVILAATLVVGRARTIAALIATLLLGAILMSLFLAPAEIFLLVGRIIESQRVLGLPNNALALPGKIVRDWNAVPLGLSAAALAAGLSFAIRRSRWSKWPGYAAIAFSLYYFWSVAPEALDGGLPDFPGLALVTLAAGYAGVVQHDEKYDWFAIVLLLGAPAAVALGTFNNQWFQLNFSLAFPFLALFVLAAADPSPWRRRAAQALAIAGPVCLMLLAASYPYSLPASVFDQQIPVEHPLTHGSILVDEETATFVRSAQGLARGALVVDLSGTGPGVDAVLGARAPILLWLNPATPTWPDVVWSRLSVADRQRAWFVAPVWPLFRHSAPAKWLVAHKSRYCEEDLPPITFWDEERSLQIWRPCANLVGAIGPPRR